MNLSEIKSEVKESVSSQIEKTGYVVPVQVLIDLNILTKMIIRTGDLGKQSIWKKCVK